MKFIISILFYVIFAKSSLAVDDRINWTLQKWYESVLNDFQQHPMYKADEIAKYFENIDIPCLQSKINLNQNRDKVYPLLQSIVIVYGSFIKCMQEDQDEFWNTYAVYYTSRGRVDEDYLGCFRLRLQQLDPESDLVKDFNPNSMGWTVEQCEKFINGRGFKDGIRTMTYGIENLTGFTCNVLEVDQLDKVMLETLSIAGIANDNERIATINKKIKSYKLKWDQTYDCLINKM